MSELLYYRYWFIQLEFGNVIRMGYRCLVARAVFTASGGWYTSLRTVGVRHGELSGTGEVSRMGQRA